MPGSIGQYSLSMSAVKSAGSSSTGSLPCGRAVASALGGAAVVGLPRPGATASGAPLEAAAARASVDVDSSLGVVLVGLVVGLGADDLEVLVELDVDLAAVVQGHLDLVLALLVADLGLGDLAAAGLLERGVLGPLAARCR